MGDRPHYQTVSVDWETAARAQGLACVVCKETPTERDREEYFATGLCADCSTAIMTPNADSAADDLRR